MSEALNLALHFDALSNTLHSTSYDIRSFRLKLKPIGLSLIYLVIYSDPNHIGIDHILQHMIEQFVHAIYKVSNSIEVGVF